MSLARLDKRIFPAFPCHQARSEAQKGKTPPPPKTPEAAARQFEGLKKTWTTHAKKAVTGELDGVHPYAQWKSRYMKQKPPRHPRIVLRETVAREHRDIQELARKFASAAMNRAFAVLGDPTAADTAVLQAADLILNRAYGKPNQTNTNLNVDANGKISEVSGAELNQRIKEALKRVEDITGRERQASARKKQPVDLRKLDRDPHGPNEPVH